MHADMKSRLNLVNTWNCSVFPPSAV